MKHLRDLEALVEGSLTIFDKPFWNLLVSVDPVGQ
jgi:hypothetical protein